MPVKVRCPECERVINAPDRAQGKAVKCPQCGTAVRVPAEKNAATKVQKKAERKVAAPRPPSSSSVFIANLDLDRIEDQQRICPKCGTEVSVEDVECPNCHVDLQTGLLSAANKAELSRKGPNPKLYYKEFVSDGLDFWKRHKRISFRLSTTWAIFTTLFVLCVFMSVYCVKPLLRDLWLFLAVINILVPPGVTWSLHTTVIDATLRKKKKLGKITFDRFLGAALGLKLIFWFLAVAAPMHLAAIAFLVAGLRGSPVALILALALEGAAVVFASLLFPLAMTHMSMPITKKAWLLNRLSAPFFRTIKPSLYWCFFLGLSLFVPILCVAAGAVFSANGIKQLVESANENSTIYSNQTEIASLSKNKELTPEQRDYQHKSMVPMHFSVLFLPAGLLIGAGTWFGLVALFSMRTNGNYARYFMDQLDLDTEEKEITYVAKAQNLTELEAATPITWKPVMTSLGLAYAVGLLLGASIGMSFYSGLVQGLTYGMLITGGVVFLVGGVWCVIVATKDAETRKATIKFPLASLASGLVCAAIGGGIFAVMRFDHGPAAPEQQVAPHGKAPGQKGAAKAGAEN